MDKKNPVYVLSIEAKKNLIHSPKFIATMAINLVKKLLDFDQNMT